LGNCWFSGRRLGRRRSHRRRWRLHRRFRRGRDRWRLHRRFRRGRGRWHLHRRFRRGRWHLHRRFRRGRWRLHRRFRRSRRRCRSLRPNRSRWGSRGLRPNRGLWRGRWTTPSGREADGAPGLVAASGRWRLHLLVRFLGDADPPAASQQQAHGQRNQHHHRDGNGDPDHARHPTILASSGAGKQCRSAKHDNRGRNVPRSPEGFSPR
jgi:hypothetical protein